MQRGAMLRERALALQPKPGFDSHTRTPTRTLAQGRRVFSTIFSRLHAHVHMFINIQTYMLCIYILCIYILHMLRTLFSCSLYNMYVCKHITWPCSSRARHTSPFQAKARLRSRTFKTLNMTTIMMASICEDYHQPYCSDRCNYHSCQ